MKEMKQHLYEPTVFLRDGQEWIKGFTMERPKHPKDLVDDYDDIDLIGYETAVDDFLMSAVEYPVERFNVK